MSVTAYILGLCFFFSEVLYTSVLALSAADRQTILNCHNNYRSTLAKGTAANLTGTMPAGSNLIQQTYNTSIEAVAQAWADQCTMSHSSNGMGENLYMTSSSTISDADAVKQACDLWWAELKQYGMQSSLVLDMAQFNKGIGHWSQQGWANTAQLGCAVARCSSSTWKTYVVCNYNEAGNWLNEVVYEKGTACSTCSSSYPGSTCNSTSGLCVLP